MDFMYHHNSYSFSGIPRIYVAADVFLYYEESDRRQTITARKPTKSMNSQQKTKEYIKGKSPLFISRKISKNNDI